jgi:hypothetical protein
MEFLRKYIFSNVLLKVLALAISFMLWVTYTSEPPAEVGFQVPLEFINMSRQMEISGEVPTLIHVRVRGRSSLLRRMTTSDLRLSLDMTDRKEGDSLIKLSPEMVVAPYGATIVGLSPDEFHVTLVPRGSPLVSAQ